MTLFPTYSVKFRKEVQRLKHEIRPRPSSIFSFFGKSEFKSEAENTLHTKLTEILRSERSGAFTTERAANDATEAVAVALRAIIEKIGRDALEIKTHTKEVEVDGKYELDGLTNDHVPVIETVQAYQVQFRSTATRIPKEYHSVVTGESFDNETTAGDKLNDLATPQAQEEEQTPATTRQGG